MTTAAVSTTKTTGLTLIMALDRITLQLPSRRQTDSLGKQEQDGSGHDG